MTFLKKVFGQSSSSVEKKHKGPEGGDAGVSSLACDKSNFAATTASSNLSLNNAVPYAAASSPPPLLATAAASSSPSPASFNFADFEVTRTLGTGSFGRVCLALHHPTGQYYAMKRLRKSDVVRLKQVEHTNNERFLLAQVDHPFLVKMACTFQDERHLYIMLEYVCGGELFSLLRKVRVGWVGLAPLSQCIYS